jgi:glucose/arabinose dehydrogenase
MVTMIRAALSALAVSATLARPAAAQQTRAPQPQSASPVAVATVAKGLNHPWGLQVLPDGRMLVTERPGRLRVIDKSGALSPPVSGVPAVAATGQGGLLDVALDPKFAENGLIYLSYAEPRGIIANGTAVARGKLVFKGDVGELAEVKIIFRQMPDHRGGLHFGARLVFARDGTLLVTLGERFQKDMAQDLATNFGKVVRINSDGSIPADNPFVQRGGPSAANWSYGHRNPQGAALHPETGKLWVVEHGPRGGDEINIVRAGKNYGWPVIGYGVDYSGAKLHDSTSKDGMEQPVYYWVPSIAPSGMAFSWSDRIPQWKGSVFVGALAGQHLARLVLDGERVVGEEKLLTNLGERIRDVRSGPDGAIYVLTDHPEGRVLRVTPER